MVRICLSHFRDIQNEVRYGKCFVYGPFRSINNVTTSSHVMRLLLNQCHNCEAPHNIHSVFLWLLPQVIIVICIIMHHPPSFMLKLCRTNTFCTFCFLLQFLCTQTSYQLQLRTLVIDRKIESTRGSPFVTSFLPPPSTSVIEVNFEQMCLSWLYFSSS